jgi:2-amino-4-hydroxy-6-hydroxymethyldihydropteridine diphosphokinase
LSFVRTSRVYESAAWTGDAAASAASAPPYWNLVLTGRTGLTAEALLAFGKALEFAAGRRRGRRFADRPLDVDLLAWGDRRSARRELLLPHPGAEARPFVVLPRTELHPDGRVLDPAAPDGGEWPRCLGPL